MKRGIFGGYGRDTVEKFISATPNDRISRCITPFGFDKVDIPLEAFCETVEAQVCAQDERAGPR